MVFPQYRPHYFVVQEDGVRSHLERRGWKQQPPRHRRPPDFFWTLDERAIDYDGLQDDQVANHFRDIAVVATKAGLTRSMNDVQWCAAGLAADAITYFPRSYALDDQDGRAAFVDDFRRTAAAAVVRGVVEDLPFVPNLLELALRVCSAWINDLEAHRTGQIASVLNDDEWHRLLEYSYVCGGGAAKPAPRKRRPASARPQKLPRDASRAAGVRSLRELGRRTPRCYCDDRILVDTTPDLLRTAAVGVARRLSELWPQWRIDGRRNVWIVKPPEACRGHGIVLKRRLEDVLSLAERMGGRVAQKYVETPMLWKDDDRRGVKFDLRLRCLFVCGRERMRSYVFEPCYARLCSQPFSLEDDALANPMVHLSNLAVQRRGESDDEDLMRTQQALEKKFATKHVSSLWSSHVRPRLAHIVAGLGACAATQASPRTQSIELLGGDVVLDADGTPWLLEANLSPALARRSDAHAATIERMLDGVLCRTLDKWLPSGIPGQSEGGDRDDGWQFVRTHSMPRPAPTNTRGFGFFVVGLKLSGADLLRRDASVSLIEAWHRLRMWWRPY